MYRFLNLQNPVNWQHPLNVARVGWWYIPLDSGWSPQIASGAVLTGPVLRDLCGRSHGTVQNGASNIPQNGVMPTGDPCLQWNTGGSIDGQVDVGGATYYSFTDNFTVGCTFITDTLAPSGTGSLAGLLNKYNSPGANEWTFRQHNATLEFGGSSLLATGSILVTNTQYRAIAVMRAGTAYIYINGQLITSGAVSISAGSDTVYIGEAYEPGGANFRGRISDAFIAARAWSDVDVMLDYQCSTRQYRVANSPLRFLDSRQFLTADGSGPDIYSDTASGTDLYQEPGIRVFEDSTRIFSDATGFGEVVQDGVQYFYDNATASPSFAGDVPTLVVFPDTAIASEVLTVGAPLMFTDTARASELLRIIVNGNPLILAQNPYRR